MPEALSKLWKQAVEFWNSLEKSQKTRLCITSAIIVLAVSLSIFFIAKLTMTM